MSYKTHEWVLIDNIWRCPDCGASGGPPRKNYLDPNGLPMKIDDWMYLEGVPTHILPVSWDCDEAKKQIEEFLLRAQENYLINL